MLQDSLVEKSSQGTFTLEGRHDISATTIGQPKHPDRVRVGGSRVDICQYFGGSSHQSSCTHNAKYEERLMEKIIKKVRVKLYDEVTEQVTERVMCQF